VTSPNSSSNPAYHPAYAGQQDDAKDMDHEHKDGEMNDEDSRAEDIGAAASRIKIYVKPSGQASEEVLARRSRKNSQSRSRANKHRDQVATIDTKNAMLRSPEEQAIWETHQLRRKRKNDRSRERAVEKKHEIDKIMVKPESKRTRIEKQFLDSTLGAKRRKNEGDRLRRHRLKELGLSPKGSMGKPGIPARGPLPPKYQDISRSKQGEPPHHHVGGYAMPPPHGYGAHPMMQPPPHQPHHHEQHPGEGPHSPGEPMYQL
jgi:hypothetical protein